MEKILIVDDEVFIRENLQRILAEDGYRTESTASPQLAIDIVAREEISLVLLDLNLGSCSGLDVLRDMREIDPDLLVIIITGYGTVESAVEALKIGAYDYIKKPFKADAIHLIVRLALETQQLRRKVRRLSRDDLGINMVGKSPAMQHIFDQIKEVAKHDNATVLITGESGTGKELVAQAIHNLSSRNQQPFVAVNCGSLPFNLLETTLFGYEPGAFSDAKSRKSGLFEEAEEGTLFLDEVGEMDLSIQVKLLRVIEDRKLRRLGGNRTIAINTRLIAATNADLKVSIENKEFREDLYYRLNVFPIHIPPLRERREDIPALLEHFLRHFSLEFKRSIARVTDEAMDMITRYSWPGNVRELRNVIERICIMHNNDHDSIHTDQLPREICSETALSEAPLTFELSPQGIVLEEMMAQVEKDLLLQAFTMASGNITATARLLNMPRGTLRYKLEKHNLSSED